MNLKQLWPMISILAVAVMMQACNESVKWHTPPECKEEGHIWCNDGCIDPKTDNAFCGADALCETFTACKDGKTCQNGECVGAGPVNHCEHGKVKCGEDCIDPNTDNTYCGADSSCQNYTACGDDKTCVGGECSAKPVDGKCNDGQVKCGEDCIDPQKNNAFCGADATCEHYDDCARQGKTCENGVCVVGEPVNECDPGKVKCGEDCIDPMTDNKYCGADAKCANYSNCAKQGNACESGKCVGGTVNDCKPGKVKCGEDCIDPNTDNTYCGADSSCQNYTACVDDKTCVGGECSVKPEDGKCPEGQVKCGESCIDPQTNNGYCGADAKCENYRSCEPDWSCHGGECQAPIECGSMVFCQGSCYFPLESWKYCGADEFCSNYTSCKKGEICEEGKCKPTNCQDGQVMCYDAGCIDPLTNNDYCGANEECQMYTPCGYGDETCQGGTCLPSTGCEKGQIKCDDKCIDPKTDNDFCGALRGCTGSMKCFGSATCVDGQCEMLHTCTPGVESRTCTVNEDGSVLVEECDGKETELHQALLRNGEHEVWVCGEDNNAILTCDDVNYIPYNGKCNPTVCKPYEGHCDGNKVMVCNHERSGFEESHECTTNDPNATASCVDITTVDENDEDRPGTQCITECKEGFTHDWRTNQCEVKICEPGTSLCNDQNNIEVLICNNTGTGTESYYTCQSGRTCENGLCTGCSDPNKIYDVWLGCTAKICEPGTISCSEDGRFIEKCSENGVRTEFLESCRQDQVCDEGTCRCEMEGFVECDGQCVESEQCPRCDEATKPSSDCTCVGADWYCPSAACKAENKPYDNCTCQDSQWDCPQFHCDPAYKPYSDCTCKNDAWDCPEFYCDADSKPFPDCKCVDSAWDCVQFHCNETLKPYADCTCEYGEWICPKVHCEDAPRPFDECTCVSNEWDCPQFHCSEATKPYDDCTCTVEEKWDCPEFYCDDAVKPWDDCECKVGAWICPKDHCDESLKTDEECVCNEVVWDCPQPRAILLGMSEGNSSRIQEGGYAYLEVSLNRAPESNVTVRLSTQNSVIAHELSEQAITFTPESWAQPVSVMLETTHDFKRTGDQRLVVTATSTSSEAAFNGLQAEQAVNVTDIDVCAVQWTPSDDLQVTEEGDEQAVEFVLTCDPGSNVTYNFQSNDLVQGYVTAGAQMTFTSQNWNEPQTLKIIGKNDNVSDGGTTFKVFGTPTAGNPEDFRTRIELNVFKTDNDDSGVNVRDSMEIKEGMQGTLRVGLATAPSPNTATVKITASVNSASGLTVTPSVLTFSRSDLTTKTFTIESARDGVTTGDRTAVLTLTVTSEDPDYNMTKTVSVNILEADKQGMVFMYDTFMRVRYGDEDWNLVYEGNDNCPHFRLKSKPKQNVTVSASTVSTSQYVTLGESVTFTPDNWEMPQCITIHTKRDGLISETDPVPYTIDYLLTSTDPAYNGVHVFDTMRLKNMDSYTIYTLPNSYQPLEGQRGYATVEFNAQIAPGSTTTLTIRSSDPTRVSLRQTSIKIDKWNKKYHVEYDVIDNHVVDPAGKHYVTLYFEVSSTDPNFNGVKSQASLLPVDAQKPRIFVDAYISDVGKVSSGSDNAWISCEKKNEHRSQASIEFRVSLSAKPSENVFVQPVFYKTDYLKVRGSMPLVFTPSNYRTPQTISVDCDEFFMFGSSIITESALFTVNNYEVYPASEVSFDFDTYALGKKRRFTGTYKGTSIYNYDTDYTGKHNIVLNPGTYKVTLVGGKGGGLVDDVDGGYVSGYAGNGGKVEAKIKLSSRIETTIYVGTGGTRSPTVAPGLNGLNANYSNGVGYMNSGKGGMGGDGDWGVFNYSYGGGAASEIHIGGTLDKPCRSIVAGGGGGATRKNKKLVGYGGNGGCTNATDSKCKGHYDKTYSNGATESSGWGGDSANLKVQGGGGGGYLGGAAGSDKYVGGNGGTSKIDTSCGNFTYSDAKYTIGAYPNDWGTIDGYVEIESLKE